jgi:DNA-binding NarL/FixJ family response regulator
MKALMIDEQACILATFQSGLLEFDSTVALVSVESLRSAKLVLTSPTAFDFVLLDLQLSWGNGFDVLAELCHSYPAASIVAVSTWISNADVVRAIYLGAVAFVPKCAGARGLLTALQTVASGHIYVPPMIIRSTPVAALPALGADPCRRIPANDDSVSGTDVHARLRDVRLTSRQSEVLALLLEGQSNKLMARGLNLSVETIKDHVAAILRILNVSSRTQAVLAVSGMSRQGSTWKEASRNEARG